MKIYLEHFFQKNISTKAMYQKYLEMDSFDDAAEILLNPIAEDFNKLLKSQLKISNEAGIERPSHLLLKLIIDLEKEEFWFWNGEFSDSESAFIDIFEEKSKVNSAGDIEMEGFLFLQGFYDEESEKILTENMMIRNSFSNQIKSMTVEDMESFLAVFSDLAEYIDKPEKLADVILNSWFYDGKLKEYLKESDLPELLESFVQSYAPQYEEELTKLGI